MVVTTSTENVVLNEQIAPMPYAIEWRSDMSDNAPERDRFAAKLWASFEDEPLEDGMWHPAEKIIGDALSSTDERALAWLEDICLDASQSSFAASVLRCLGRHANVGAVSWRVGLVRNCLAEDSVEIRDAAVQAVEGWEDHALIAVLESHDETETWLRRYIKDVVEDLTE